MPFIKLRMSNELGEAVGTLVVNTDQILTISVGPKATELSMSDGHTKWVLDSPDEIVKMIR